MAIEAAPFGTEPFSVRDLEGIPDDGRFYELSNGALIVTPAPNTRHQQIAVRVVLCLEQRRLPSQAILMEADLYIRDDMVKRPDVQVVDESMIGGQRIMGTPALIVEVASRSTATLDRTEKRVAYAAAGIPAYWLVDDTAQTITILELEDGAYVERAVLGPRDTFDVAGPTPFTLDASVTLA